MNSKPFIFVGFIALLMSALGWLLLRLNSARVIRLPDRVRVG